MTALRVLIATPLYPPEPGGPATYTKLLETHLPEHKIRVTTAVFASVRRLPKVLRHIAYLCVLIRKGWGTRVVYALDPVSVGLPAYWYARLTGKRFVVKIVGDYAWEQGTQRFGVRETLDVFLSHAQSHQVVRLLQMLETYVANGADLVVVPSEYLKDVVTRWNLRHTRIQVIENAIALEEAALSSDGETLLERPYVLAVGRLVPWKQFDKVIEAVSRARQTVPDLELVIVGDGPERAALEAHARTHLPEACTFLGARTHAETVHYMRHAEVFVLYSTYEGLSHVLIEALMVGVPIVASAIRANTDVVGDAARTVPPTDGAALAQALVEVTTDVTLRETLCRRAHERAARYSVPVMIASTARILQT